MARTSFWSKFFSGRSSSQRPGKQRLSKKRRSNDRRLSLEPLETRYCLSAYHATLLGSLDGAPLVPTGINSSGDVSGYYISGGQNHAFLYSGGVAAGLGTLGGSSSYAFGLNDAGQVVGESRVAGGANHAFIYSAGVMTDLGTLDGSGVDSAATAINNAGQITGYSQIF
jgi:probable HAF family extracellular repeat protein